MALTPLTAGDADLIHEIVGSDHRLFMRVGALLQDSLAMTRLLVEEIPRDPALRKLVMDRTLKQIDEESLPDLLARHDAEDVGVVMETVSQSGRDWRVLGLEDERDNPFAAAAEPEADNGTMAAMLPTLAAPVRASVEGLMQAKGDDDRAAALEQLRYAAPSLDVLAGLMPIVLADSAQVVRERGLALVAACGARPLVVDVIRALHRGDEREITRLAEQLQDLQPVQERLIVGAVLALLSQGTLTPAMVSVLARVAPALAAHQDLERACELLLLHGQNLSLLALMRALQEVDREATDAALRRLMGVNPEQDARLVLYLAREDAPDQEDLLDRGLHLLLGSTDAGGDRLSLAQVLRRMVGDRRLSAALSERADRLRNCRDSTPFWILAETCRSGDVTQADADRLADAITGILREGQGPHVVAILEQQLPAILPCSAPKRSEMVAPLAELAARFRDSRSRELILANLESMGAAAAEALWGVLDMHPTGAVRQAVASVLPVVLEHEEQLEASVRRLLELCASAADSAEQAALTLAAARVLDRIPGDASALCSEVDAAAERIGLAAVEAKASLAAGVHIDPQRRLAISEQLLGLVTADIEDDASTATVDPTTQEVTFHLDPKLSAHTDIVPRALAGLVRIAASPQLPSQAQRRLVIQLIGQWRKVSNWQILWGPGNILELARTLSRIGAAPATGNPLRLQIAEALQPRATQLRVAHHLTRLFAAGSGARLASIAGRTLTAIITAVSQEYYADDELADLCEVLVAYLFLPDLGEQDRRLRSQISSLLRSYRSHCDARVRATIRDQREQLPEGIGKELDWA